MNTRMKPQAQVLETHRIVLSMMLLMGCALTAWAAGISLHVL